MQNTERRSQQALLAQEIGRAKFRPVWCFDYTEDRGTQAKRITSPKSVPEDER